MRLRPIHVALGIAVPAALGLLILLVVRTAPGNEDCKTEDRGRKAEDGRQRTQDSAPLRPSESVLRNPSSVVGSPSSGVAPYYRYKVARSYPHDRRAFTQGLVYEDGYLYEGTGLHGRSALTKRDLQTGQVLKTLRLPDHYFGEGITLFGGKLFQLTWQSGIGFRYDKDTFTPLGEFQYPGEGWGLTHDGRRLILSDGTATLRFLDPNTCTEIGRLVVRDGGRPVPNLNELEFLATPPAGIQPGTPADGPHVYANIWPTERIAIIDAATGRVTGWIDLSGLYTPPAQERGESVLNGIAYLPETGRLLVTGKCWPRMFEIELVPAAP
jgi:glutaminyl-peptide cyclotransferase